MSDGVYTVGNILVTAETIVDAAVGSLEQQIEAALWLDEQTAQRRVRWAALPWYTRAYWRLRNRWWGAERRLAHAWAALRGIECER